MDGILGKGVLRSLTGVLSLAVDERPEGPFLRPRRYIQMHLNNIGKGARKINELRSSEEAPRDRGVDQRESEDPDPCLVEAETIKRVSRIGPV